MCPNSQLCGRGWARADLQFFVENLTPSGKYVDPPCHSNTASNYGEYGSAMCKLNAASVVCKHIRDDSTHITT